MRCVSAKPVDSGFSFPPHEKFLFYDGGDQSLGSDRSDFCVKGLFVCRLELVVITAYSVEVVMGCLLVGLSPSLTRALAGPKWGWVL